MNDRIAKEVVEKVNTLVHPILSREGMELVDLEFRRESKGWVLRLYLDKEGGITLDDCSRISQELGRDLDIEDVIPIPYTLEVSSPGLNRPLKTYKDFIRYCKHLVQIKTFSPIGNRRRFKGRLQEVSENRIGIEVDGVLFQIPISNVAKAHLEIDPEMLQKGLSAEKER